MADKLTPMQAYAQRTFYYMVDWIEKGIKPPESKVINTNPIEDIYNPDDLDW